MFCLITNIEMFAATVMRGYLNRPAATAQTIDRDGWLHTGDVGNFDANGDFYVVDRIKELIKVKGLQVSPAELEDLLLGHPKIADVAVIGVVDKNVAVDIGEELPKAFIVRKDASLSEVEVKDYVKVTCGLQTSSNDCAISGARCTLQAAERRRRVSRRDSKSGAQTAVQQTADRRATFRVQAASCSDASCAISRRRKLRCQSPKSPK